MLKNSYFKGLYHPLMLHNFTIHHGSDRTEKTNAILSDTYEESSKKSVFF